MDDKQKVNFNVKSSVEKNMKINEDTSKAITKITDGKTLYYALLGNPHIKKLAGSTKGFYKNLNVFCANNFKKVPEAVKKEDKGRDFVWPQSKISIKIFTDRVYLYLKDIKNWKQSEKGLVKVMAETCMNCNR